jgi:hypothetical protein
LRARAAALFAVMPWHNVEHGVETRDPESIAAGLAGDRRLLCRPADGGCFT